jgi:hypothetical protein
MEYSPLPEASHDSELCSDSKLPLSMPESVILMVKVSLISGYLLTVSAVEKLLKKEN